MSGACMRFPWILARMDLRLEQLAVAAAAFCIMKKNLFINKIALLNY